MSGEANKETVIGMWRAFGSRDAARTEGFLAENAVWIAPRDNATAKFLGVPSGMTGRVEIVRFIIDQFPRIFLRDVKMDYKGIYADGEAVVVEATLSATIANGRPYRNDYCFIHIVKDGKVVEMREFMDTYNGHRMVYGNEATI
jgi:ketosteroid isomerase-like protein